ncbi:hypothetical protein [Streptomyces sp. NPDC088847]|uniref:hypothetical protein n=1 Tax=Streptomyces sp. NPDC088847 TaxID=3365909 RepID=UPI00381631FB
MATPFTASSTAVDVIADVNLTDRAMTDTGASSGTGVETARALAASEVTSLSPSAIRQRSLRDSP